MSIPQSLSTDNGGVAPWAGDEHIYRILVLFPGGFLPVFVRWANAKIGGPLIFHLACGLALLSAVAPMRARTPWLAGTDSDGLPLNLNVFLVPPGYEQANHVIEIILDLVRDILGKRLVEKPGRTRRPAKVPADGPRVLQAWGINKRFNNRNFAPVLYDEAAVTTLTSIPERVITAPDSELSWMLGVPRHGAFAYSNARSCLDCPSADPHQGSEVHLRKFLTHAVAVSDRQTIVGVELDPAASGRFDRFIAVMGAMDGYKSTKYVGGLFGHLFHMTMKVAVLFSFAEEADRAYSESDEIKSLIVSDRHLDAAVRLAAVFYAGGVTVATDFAPNTYRKNVREASELIGTEWTSYEDIVRASTMAPRTLKNTLDALVAMGRVAKRMIGGSMSFRRLDGGRTPGQQAGSAAGREILSFMAVIEHVMSDTWSGTVGADVGERREDG